MPQIKVKSNQVKVRMYRIGHGDCFLLSFYQGRGKPPYFMLIDCGYKPGSQKYLHHTNVKEIVDDLFESTGGRIDLFVITHEHQDHCNGITKTLFDRFEIANAWFAWTEDPNDDLANELRKNHHDILLGLHGAYSKMALALGDDDASVKSLAGLLELESGETEMGLLAASDPAKSENKLAIKLVKDKVRDNGGDDHIEFLQPGDCKKLPDGPPVKTYVLGPPRDEGLLEDEDPHGSEGFRRLSFSAATSIGTAGKDAPTITPFARQFVVNKAEAESGASSSFFLKHYGFSKLGVEPIDNSEIVDHAEWRWINEDWLHTAENLAIKLNTGINNTSLVLAFELPKSKKILLFVGDAQRGNWITWADQSWDVNGKLVTAKDILGRTVLYKVGHHGSHNATLAGTIDDEYANLTWMGQGRYAKEFTAMITAVNEWAMTKNTPPWVHPLPSIRKALLAKCSGRVFQTDKDEPTKPEGVSQTEWNAFIKQVECENLYFDLTIADV